MKIKIYISDGTWFEKGSICLLQKDIDGGCGIFIGIPTKENSLSLGQKFPQLDSEGCSNDEFEIKEIEIES